MKLIINHDYKITIIYLIVNVFRSRVSNLSFDGSVSYENLNMDYIAQLCGEGYTQSRVIRALGITRNDLTMARDILQEFALPSNSEKKS